MSKIVQHTVFIPDEMAGMRLDQALAQLFDSYSRARLQQWISAGQVLVDGRVLRPKDKVEGGEWVELSASLEEETTWRGQAVPLEVVYEDQAMIVINKPPGLVVHPAAGNREGTLANALLNYAPELAQLPRAGIVHRLDKDTSGLLVVARHLQAQKSLVEQLQARSLSREYDALVVGLVVSGGTIDAPLGRHPKERTRMAVREGGRVAVTHYRVQERFRAHSYLKVQLETGRTHQIRVHLAYIHHPILGDPVYGGRLRLPPESGPALTAALRGFKRQALHAGRLGLIHPESGEEMEWCVDLPEDMAQLLVVLREDARHHG